MMESESAELECFHFLLTPLAYDSVAYDLVKTRMSELKAEGVVPENIHTPPTEGCLQFEPPPPPDFPFQRASGCSPLPPGISMIFSLGRPYP